MDAEQARGFLLSLPHVSEAAQFGGILFWLGDKAIGGRMFALMNPEGQGLRISFPAGAEHAAELLEREGLVPAPYMARIHWVAAERWGALRNREWIEELTAAHALTFAKLAPGARKVLALPMAEQRRVVRERRAMLAEKEAAKAAAKPAKRTLTAKPFAKPSW